MTTVAPPKRSDMDLLRADDQMDLASSPAMQTEDVEFDLDDVREASAEPSHDLMLQDELEQATADSDPMRSTTADHVDDDLMLDEDTVIHHEDQSEIPEMNMQNQEYEDVHTDQDDDILYEDEEQPQDQDGFPSASLKEQQMEDELRAREHQLTEEVQIGEDVEVEVEVKTEGDTNLVAGESVQEAGEINDPSEPLQSVTAATLAESGEGAEAAPEMAANFIQEQHTPAKSLEDIAENAILGQGAKGKRDEADLNVEPNENLDSNEGAINDSDVDGFKAISGLPAPEASASDTGANLLTNIKQGSVRQPSLSPVLPIVKVHYQGTEMDLFHLSHDEAAAVYFLGDVKLAQESLDKMLGACREVLVDSIGEDDELVLDIASLGLHISEVSFALHAA